MKTAYAIRLMQAYGDARVMRLAFDYNRLVILPMVRKWAEDFERQELRARINKLLCVHVWAR